MGLLSPRGTGTGSFLCQRNQADQTFNISARFLKVGQAQGFPGNGEETGKKYDKII
jgi:hypothetical protein